MITKKLWNSFDIVTREKILRSTVKGITHSVYSQLLSPYNHDFNHGIVGKILKEVLASCALQNDGSIKVSVIVEPSFAQAETYESAQNKRLKDSTYSLVNTSQRAQQMAAVIQHVHEETVAHCEYCGKPLSRSDVNDYGSLCERCYMKEYYGTDDVC